MKKSKTPTWLFPLQSFNGGKIEEPEIGITVFTGSEEKGRIREGKRSK